MVQIIRIYFKLRNASILVHKKNLIQITNNRNKINIYFWNLKSSKNEYK